jgi:hypothetical protein
MLEANAHRSVFIEWKNDVMCADIARPIHILHEAEGGQAPADGTQTPR